MKKENRAFRDSVAKEKALIIRTVLRNANTLQTLELSLQHSHRMIHIFKALRSQSLNQKERHNYRKQSHVWYLLQHYIEKSIEMKIADAIEKQEYLLLPEHERTGVTRYRYLASLRLETVDLFRITGYQKLMSLGWYNRESNPFGVVKDHKLSVKFGYDNKIDPAVLGHPANCEFLTVAENARKSSNCSLSVLELQDKIKKWEKP